MLIVPLTASPIGRWPGTSTTPGWTSSLTRKHQADLAAVVEQAHGAAVGEAARGGILGMQDAERLALALAQEADAGEGRVRLEVAGRGQQAQRPLGGVGHLDRIGLPVGHRREALLGELLGDRTRACPTACANGWPFQSCLMWIGSPANSFAGSALEAGPVEPLNSSCAASSRRQGEDRVGQAHARGQRLRHVEVRARLAAAARRPGGPTASSRRRRRGRDPRSRDSSSPAARCRRNFAVSVMKGSCTTVNRSSRARPFRTLCDLGAGHGRIVGRDVERADRRVLHVEQLFAQPQVIDHARSSPGPTACAPRRS